MCARTGNEKTLAAVLTSLRFIVNDISLEVKMLSFPSPRLSLRRWIKKLLWSRGSLDVREPVRRGSLGLICSFHWVVDRLRGGRWYLCSAVPDGA